MDRMSVYRRFRRCLWQAYCRVAQPSLVTLAAHHGTDKLTHGYINAYAHWFAGWRQRALNLLEIGVGGYDVPQDGGNSLRMWRDFFPRTMIHAIDIADKSPHVERRVRIFQGSQADPAFLCDVARRIGRLDIIIDDGSHVSSHIITSFSTLFPLLADGGLYVIEDLHTSYWSQYGGKASVQADGTSVALIKQLLDGLHHAWIPGRTPESFDTSVAAIHAYPGIVFIIKGRNTPDLSNGMREEILRAAK